MPNASNVQIRDSSNNLVTVSTLDALMADGGSVTFGAKTDAASAITNTTAISAMSIWKQLSVSLQAIATSIAGTLTFSLPTGAATAANQTTEIANLVSIATNSANTNTILGAKTDAKDTHTDATSVSIMQVMKQISASLQTLAVSVNITDITQAEYETVAAGSTAQVLGGAGATGDYIAGVLVTPSSLSPGNVLLLDGATSITIFTGGGSSISNLVPFYIPLGMKSVSGPWKLTTGNNLSAIGIGNFT